MRASIALALCLMAATALAFPGQGFHREEKDVCKPCFDIQDDDGCATCLRSNNCQPDKDESDDCRKKCMWKNKWNRPGCLSSCQPPQPIPPVPCDKCREIREDKDCYDCLMKGGCKPEPPSEKDQCRKKCYWLPFWKQDDCLKACVPPPPFDCNSCRKFNDDDSCLKCLKDHQCNPCPPEEKDECRKKCYWKPFWKHDDCIKACTPPPPFDCNSCRKYNDDDSCFNCLKQHNCNPCPPEEKDECRKKCYWKPFWKHDECIKKCSPPPFECNSCRQMNDEYGCKKCLEDHSCNPVPYDEHDECRKRCFWGPLWKHDECMQKCSHPANPWCLRKCEMTSGQCASDCKMWQWKCKNNCQASKGACLSKCHPGKKGRKCVRNCQRSCDTCNNTCSFGCFDKCRKDEWWCKKSCAKPWRG